MSPRTALFLTLLASSKSDGVQFSKFISSLSLGISSQTFQVYLEGKLVEKSCRICDVSRDNLVLTPELRLRAQPREPTPSVCLFDTESVLEPKQLIDSVQAGLALEYQPSLTRDGMGGTYLVCGSTGRHCAIFKPRDEEPFTENNPRGHIGVLGQVFFRDLLFI